MSSKRLTFGRHTGRPAATTSFGRGERAQILRRIGVEHQQIGGLADLDGSGLVSDVQNLGVDLRRGVQRLGRSEPGVMGEQIQFRAMWRTE
jgi:hypothetical protein